VAGDEPTPPQPGMPRWLVIAIASKLVVITLIVAAIVWYASR
jgi:hypothetical protein